MATVTSSYKQMKPGKIVEGRTENGCYWQYFPRGKGQISFSCKNLGGETGCVCKNELETAFEFNGERSGGKFCGMR